MLLLPDTLQVNIVTKEFLRALQKSFERLGQATQVAGGTEMCLD